MVMSDEECSLCHICGDVGSGKHYGVLSCEACKGFFKRTVQNDQKYVCVTKRRNCVVDRKYRNKCKQCRYDKCIAAGMKRSALRGTRKIKASNYFSPSSSFKNRPKKTATRHLKRRELSITEVVNLLADETDSQLSLITNNNYQNAQNLKSGPILSNDSKNPKSSCGKKKKSDISGPNTTFLLKDLLVGENKSSSCYKEPKKEEGRGLSVKDLKNGAIRYLKSVEYWAGSLHVLNELQLENRKILLLKAWNDILVLNITYNTYIHNVDGQILLPNGVLLHHTSPHLEQLGLRRVFPDLLDFIERIKNLKLTKIEYYYLKMIILLNPFGTVAHKNLHYCVSKSQEVYLDVLKSHITRMYTPAYAHKFESILNLCPLLRLCSHIIEGEIINNYSHGGTEGLAFFNIVYKNISFHSYLNKTLTTSTTTTKDKY